MLHYPTSASMLLCFWSSPAVSDQVKSWQRSEGLEETSGDMARDEVILNVINIFIKSHNTLDAYFPFDYKLVTISLNQNKILNI